MEKVQAIPYHVLFVRALAKDFDDKKTNWASLYDELYIAGTDIYKEFITTLEDVDVKRDDVINYKEVLKQTDKYETTFIIDGDDIQTITNTATNSETKIPKNVSVDVILSRLGFSRKISL